MVLKIVKALWFFSLVAWFVSFMFIYASLPEQVLIQESANRVLIFPGKDFYLFLALIAVINLQVFAISRLFRGQEAFLTWFYGLIVWLNFFFIVVLNFVNLYNSGEKFRYEAIGSLIYGSIGVLVMWVAAWPFFLLFRKFVRKETV